MNYTPMQNLKIKTIITLKKEIMLWLKTKPLLARSTF